MSNKMVHLEGYMFGQEPKVRTIYSYNSIKGVYEDEYNIKSTFKDKLSYYDEDRFNYSTQPESFSVSFSDKVKFASQKYPKFIGGTVYPGNLFETTAFKMSELAGDMEEAFANSNITHISSIPKTVTSMVLSFWNCRKFNSEVTIPKSVQNIEGIFMDCSVFNSPVKFEDKFLGVAKNSFRNCYIFNQPIINNNFQSLDFTFMNCYNFNQSLALPASLGKYSFYNCYDFNSPFIYDNSKRTAIYLDEYCFYDCYKFNQPFINIEFKATSYGSDRGAFGQFAFSNCIDFNQEVYFNFKDYKVNSIRGLFADAKSLNSKIYGLDSAEKMIEDAAEIFRNCKNFNQPININAYDLSYAFEGAKSLNSEINVMESVNLHSTFAICENFNNNVHILNAVDVSRIFAGCSSLNSEIIFPETVTNFAEAFFTCNNYDKDLTIPNSVTNLRGAFSGCENLSSAKINISTSAKDISNIFWGCNKYKGDGLNLAYRNYIERADYAFYKCSNIILTPYFTQGVNLTSLIHTFDGSYQLTNVYIGPSIKTLESTFCNINVLPEKITIPSTVDTISHTFAGSHWRYDIQDTGQRTPIRPSESVFIEIEEGVKNIKASAFVNCGNIIVGLPETTPDIEDYSFGSYNKYPNWPGEYVPNPSEHWEGKDDAYFVCWSEDLSIDTSKWGVANIYTHSWGTEILTSGTCVEAGGTYKPCTRCGYRKWISRGFLGGHVYGDDGVCIYCGLGVSLESYFDYEIKDGYAVIIGIHYDEWDTTFGKGSLITFPKTLSGYPTLIDFIEEGGE